MKKLIAISVLFALLAAGAFAQVSGGFRGHWNVVDYDSDKDGVTTSAGIDVAQIQLTGENEEGTIGATMRLRNWQSGYYLDWDPDAESEEASDWVSLGGGIELSHYWAWWKPIPQLQLALGQQTDGWWGFDGIIGWGFHEGGADYGHMEGYSFWQGGGGGYNAFGLAIEIKPVEGLEIDFGLPLPRPWAAQEYEDVFKTLYVKASYDISGIGTASVKFSSLGYVKDKYLGDINVGFSLSAIENVPVILLLQFGLNDGDSEHNPIGVALGVGFSSGDFGVRFRAGSQFVKDGKFNLHAQVMPFYDLGIFKAFLNIGLQIENDDQTRFYLNPYITKQIGAGKIALAIQLDINENNTTFALPLTISYDF